MTFFLQLEEKLVPIEHFFSLCFDLNLGPILPRKTNINSQMSQSHEKQENSKYYWGCCQQTIRNPLRKKINIIMYKTIFGQNIGHSHCFKSPSL